MLSNKILEIIEENGFTYDIQHQVDEDYYIELNQDTPAGEDWWYTVWFDGTDEDFINSLRKGIYDFDVDEEVELWVDSRGKNRVPSSIKVLIEDAEWKLEQLKNLLDALEKIDLQKGDASMITLFVLESVNDDFDPVVYAIPLEKQLEVENIAKDISKDLLYARRPYKAFEDKLRENGIKYEWIGFITIKSYDERQIDWIDDKIPRELVG